MDELRDDDPRWIGAYRLLGRLGTGGMGRVYLARSEGGRTVAVKLVRAELAAQEEFRTRFRREVRAARRVGGRWTAPVLDADTEAEIPWVATGYVAGPSLQEVVARGYGPLPERSVRVLAAGLAHALGDIHTAGLVHRDLKPSNVMITIDGPRVIDFGIARALETVADGSLTHTGAMVGSPAFMSPEQVRGDRVTPACDVFCLGSVLAYAATGLQPFGAASSGVHAQMFRIAQEPPDLDAVPEGLRELITACLVKEPEGRPSLAWVLEWVAGADPGANPGSGSGVGSGSGAGVGSGAGAASGPAVASGAGPGGGPGAGRDAEPWLPGGIVAELGRHAVGLLELEAAPREAPRGAAETVTAVPAAPPPPPGPPALEPPGAPGPVPAARPAYGPAPGTTTVPGTTRASGSPAGAEGGSGGDGDGDGDGDEPDPGPPGRRARRGARAAVLALLAVIAGGTTAYVVVHEGAGSAGKAHAAPPSTAPPTSTPVTTDPTMAGGTLAELVGTWRTVFTTDIGDNVRTLTIRPDGSVRLAGTNTGYSCVWSMRITSQGPPALLSPSQVVSGAPAGSCTPGAASFLSLLDPTHLRRDDVDGDKAPLTYERIG